MNVTYYGGQGAREVKCGIKLNKLVGRPCK